MAELLVKDAEKWFRREDGEPFKVIDRLSFDARKATHRFADVLVIGAGIAGLRAALEVPDDLSVLVVTKDRLTESIARFEEGIEQVRDLLERENVSSNGKFHRYENVTSLPPTHT